ncbi:hypothetical protein SDC9_139909 [bioreactor metagenome]|uniref:Uncharacterized protein n=1 Tax=bioreactor metagenome TaxID=1076179 RepID=A0A645DVZ2_9ZZZZ
MALPAPDWDLQLARLPAIGGRNSHRVVGKVQRNMGLQRIDVNLRRMAQKKFQRHGKSLPHLRLGGPQSMKPRIVHQSRHRLKRELPRLTEIVRPAQQLNVGRGDMKLLLRLPQGALLGRLPRFHPAAGETNLAALAAQRRGSDLKEKVQPILFFHKGAQYRVFVFPPQQSRHAVPPQGFQRLRVHPSKKERACR